MARIGILRCIFDLAFFLWAARSGEEVENERHEEGERERSPRGSGGWGTVRGRRARGEMGEGRQVMLGPRHTRGERKIDREKEREGGGREKKREKAREKEGAQTHVLRILRRARTHVRQRTRLTHMISTYTGAEAF